MHNTRGAMSVKRIIAVAVIYAIAGAGWWLLGTATAIRSDTVGGRLAPRVAALWGEPLRQEAPVFTVQNPGRRHQDRMVPEENHIRVMIQPDYRRKGLNWYPTYTCDFSAAFTVQSGAPVTQKVRLHFTFPSAKVTYDQFSITLDGSPINAAVDPATGVDHLFELAPGQRRVLRVAYLTRGLGQWRYVPDPALGRMRHLTLVAETGFRAVDYPDGALSPMQTEPTNQGMRLTWKAEDLITRSSIGLIVPEKLNPGPLTTRITFFAPVCLIFFFVLIGAINVLYGVDIHPMHYLFVAAGFFAFHLLLVYLVGVLNIHLSFLIAAAVSVALVTAYLAGALRGRFPWKMAAAGQLAYLVLFSYSFFLKGVTGLTVAVGSVATLAILMKVTLHTDWSAVFAARTMVPPPLPSAPAAADADSGT